MKNNYNILSSAIVFMLFTALATISYAQTEGFNVKTPIEKIADSATEFLNQIVSQSKKQPKKSIPQDLVCGSSCFLAIPNIDIVPSRGDFTGTGLLSCRANNSSKFTEPIYYKINNLDNFNEAGGGLIIFASSNKAMKELLGDNLHLTSDNSSAGSIGSTSEGTMKKFVSYAKYNDANLEGIDLSGSILEYSSKDTFNAYQGTVVPIEILISPQNVPPMLRDFGSSLKEWTKGCK